MQTRCLPSSSNPNEWLTTLEPNIRRWKDLGYEPHAILLPGDHGVVFRTLTKKEFQVLVESVQQTEGTKLLGLLYSDQYQELISTALLYPTVLSPDWLAGADRLIADAIVAASAWVSTESLNVGLEKAREYASSLQGFIESKICATFHSYKKPDLQNLKFTELMELLAMAEIASGAQIDLRPWTDPEGYLKDLEKQQKQAERMARARATGVDTPDPRMDPGHRAKLVELAEASKSRLRARGHWATDKPEVGKIDFESQNRGMTGV